MENIYPILVCLSDFSFPFLLIIYMLTTPETSSYIINLYLTNTSNFLFFPEVTMNPGKVAGVAVGATMAVLLLLFVAVFFVCGKRRHVLGG